MNAALSASDYLRASELAKRSLKANRLHSSTLRALTIAEVELGHLEEAKARAQARLSLEPDFTVSGFIERSPSSLYPTGPVWAKALERAGIPL